MKTIIDLWLRNMVSLFMDFRNEPGENIEENKEYKKEILSFLFD